MCDMHFVYGISNQMPLCRNLSNSRYFAYTLFSNSNRRLDEIGGFRTLTAENGHLVAVTLQMEEQVLNEIEDTHTTGTRQIAHSYIKH